MSNLKRCENCEHYSGFIRPDGSSSGKGYCWRPYDYDRLARAHGAKADGTCEHFELPHDIDHLERIIREAGKVREYGGGLAGSVNPSVYLGAVTGITLSGIGGVWGFCIALAALTPEQRAVVARKVLEEAE